MIYAFNEQFKGKAIGHDKEFGFKHDGRVIFRYRLRFPMPKGIFISISRPFYRNIISATEKIMIYFRIGDANCCKGPYCS